MNFHISIHCSIPDADKTATVYATIAQDDYDNVDDIPIEYIEMPPISRQGEL